jgi:hypothetical protein
MADNFINEFAEYELTLLLQLWLTPGIPRSLDQRVNSSLLWIKDYQLGLASPRITRTHTEVSMKRCNACDEEFADKFGFCPIDGAPLNQLNGELSGQRLADGAKTRVAAVTLVDKREFNLTMIGSTGLPQRLVTEVFFVIDQAQHAWPEFKRDPIGSSKRASIAAANRFKQLVLAPNALAGGVTAVLALLFAIMAVLFLGNATTIVNAAIDIEQPVVEIINLKPPVPDTKPEGTGVGAKSKGRVGLASGKGEGSAPEPQRARGGGGSGKHDSLPAQQGATPPPSPISAPINPPLPNAALPNAGIDIDPALWKVAPATQYGDARSQSTVASKGPGEGGAFGTGNGLGIGEGTGNGFGPGSDGNIGGGPKALGDKGPGSGKGGDPRDTEHIFPPRDVQQRARVISKPEAGYTEEARKEAITGTVVLRAVFSLSGEVIGIRAIKTLPGGLTERAIAAARQIRFVPAIRDGRPVSCYMQLEYNFNLY